VKVFKAIENVMADLSKIGIAKDKTNQQQGFKYRGVDQVMNELSVLLPKHGLLILPRVTKYSCVERMSASNKPLFYTILEVEYDFIASEDGSTKVVGPMIGEAMDSGDKSANKAMAIAYKYACFQAFCIPTEAVTDPDAEIHEPLSPAQVLGKRLVEALAIGIDEALVEIFDEGMKDKKTAKAAWDLLTPEEQKKITAALERVKGPPVKQAATNGRHW
jgi:hypothetical protein